MGDARTSLQGAEGDHHTMGPSEAAVAARLLAVPRVAPVHEGIEPGSERVPQRRREALDARGLRDVEVVRCPWPPSSWSPGVCWGYAELEGELVAEGGGCLLVVPVGGTSRLRGSVPDGGLVGGEPGRLDDVGDALEDGDLVVAVDLGY